MKILLLIVLFLGRPVAAQTPLWELRDQFDSARDSKKALDELLELHRGSRTPVVQGYLALAYMLKASLAVNPFDKLILFREGKAILENAIGSDPYNPELRLLRLSVQRELPALLNYSAHISDDLSFIRNRYRSIGDNDLRRRINEYFRLNQLKL